MYVSAKMKCFIYGISHSSGDVCFHSLATATAAEQSLREEHGRRAESEAQLKNRDSGELPTICYIFIVCALTSIYGDIIAGI